MKVDRKTRQKWKRVWQDHPGEEADPYSYSEHLERNPECNNVLMVDLMFTREGRQFLRWMVNTRRNPAFPKPPWAYYLLIMSEVGPEEARMAQPLRAA